LPTLSRAQPEDAKIEERSPLIAIVGPTAVGKTTLSIHLALRLNGEIVSADSRQVYRYLDIGTAKATPEERAGIPHHMIDIVDPDEPYNVALYHNGAVTAIQQVLSKGKTPILVGGSGLYVKSLIGGLNLPSVPPDWAYRNTMEALAKKEGIEAVWQELHRVDPAAAESIGHHNLRRMIRALEVWHLTGKAFSIQTSVTEPSWDVITIGLTTERSELYSRIDERVDWMVENGIIDETKGLVDMGYSWDLPSMSSLGYRQMGEYLRGETSLDEVVQKIKHQTHRYARQQYTWFRTDDPKIGWFDASKEGIIDAVYNYILQRLN